MYVLAVLLADAVVLPLCKSVEPHLAVWAVPCDILGALVPVDATRSLAFASVSRYDDLARMLVHSGIGIGTQHPAISKEEDLNKTGP